MNLLIIVIIAVIIFGILKYVYNNKTNYFTNTSNKTLNYFGGDYCPHSNKDSRTYKLIEEEFANKYPDVKVNYYWSNPNNIEEFKKARADYVPTITNNNYDHIKLALPEGTNPEDYNDDELKDLLLENIYNQL